MIKTDFCLKLSKMWKVTVGVLLLIVRVSKCSEDRSENDLASTFNDLKDELLSFIPSAETGKKIFSTVEKISLRLLYKK